MQHRGTELHFPRVRSQRRSEAHRLVSFSHVRLQPALSQGSAGRILGTKPEHTYTPPPI